MQMLTAMKSPCLRSDKVANPSSSQSIQRSGKPLKMIKGSPGARGSSEGEGAEPVPSVRVEPVSVGSSQVSGHMLPAFLLGAHPGGQGFPPGAPSGGSPFRPVGDRSCGAESLSGGLCPGPEIDVVPVARYACVRIYRGPSPPPELTRDRSLSESRLNDLRHCNSRP